MTKLGVSSKATWAEDECLIWVTDLLEVKELSEWVHKSISNFSVSYENLLHRERIINNIFSLPYFAWERILAYQSGYTFLR